MIKYSSITSPNILTAEIDNNKRTRCLRIEVSTAKSRHFVNRTQVHVALSIQQGDCPASALNEQFDSGAWRGFHFYSHRNATATYGDLSFEPKFPTGVATRIECVDHVCAVVLCEGAEFVPVHTKDFLAGRIAIYQRLVALL